MKATFFKDRQKFAAAHFTVFPDGSAERLHGHNYTVRVAFSGESLELGLMAPFSVLKKEIDLLCKQWDEYVFLPSASPWGTVSTKGNQIEFALKTPLLDKHYSFPKEDVVLLDCDNISCENLVVIFASRLAARIPQVAPHVTAVEVTIAESNGQEVTQEITL